MPQTLKSREVLRQTMPLPCAQAKMRGEEVQRKTLVERAAQPVSLWLALPVLALLFAAGQVLWWYTK